MKRKSSVLVLNDFFEDLKKQIVSWVDNKMGEGGRGKLYSHALVKWGGHYKMLLVYASKSVRRSSTTE